MRHGLGLDVGTTSLKGLLVAEDGRVVAGASRDYPTSTPRPGWSEQDPEDWALAALAVARELAGAGPRIDAIGLSGQMHGSVFLDAGGRVLHPAILWNDQRSAAECDEIERLTDDRIVEWTLNPPRTAFTATKILWARKHLPEVHCRTACVLLPKDYVRFRLSGTRASDVTDASGTCLFDVRARRWSKPALDALAIPAAWLPPVVESVELAGAVTAVVAAATGLATGTPIAGGAADQAAAALGNGVTTPGVLSITLGTSGVVYAQLAEVVADPSGAFHTFCHSVPGSWQVMAGVLSAGGSLRWFRDRLAPDGDYDAVARGVAEVAPGAQGLVFLPYLTGERSPHADPDARGCFLGLTTRHDRRHLARAVMEGVAFALRDLVDIVDGLGVPIADVRIAGGGARGGVWLQILADVLGREVRPSLTPDASAYGAAALAIALASGRDVPEIAAAWARTGEPLRPRPAHAEVHARVYEVFRALYPATAPLMHRLADIDRTALPS